MEFALSEDQRMLQDSLKGVLSEAASLDQVRKIAVGDAAALAALDTALDAGFTPLITPTLVKPEVMSGTGFLGAHADEIYYLPADDLYLTGTSEVALAGYHRDEIIDSLDEPMRYAGWSTCYRREAGAAGKDNRGILRVHQFNKLEMFSYVEPEQAEAERERRAKAGVPEEVHFATKTQIALQQLRSGAIDGAAVLCMPGPGVAAT